MWFVLAWTQDYEHRGMAMKPEDLFEIATWGQLASDPVRPRLYFVEQQPDKKANRMRQRLMVMDLDHGTVRPLTAGSQDYRPEVSPDGRWLAFLSRRSGSAQLWRMRLDGGEPEQMSFIQGGVKDLAWASDHSGWVVVAHIEHGLLEREHTAAEPSPDAPDIEWGRYYNRDVKHITHQWYKLDGAGFFDEGRDQLVWVSAGGHMELLTSGFHNYGEPRFSPAGDALYALRRDYDPEDGRPSDTVVERWSWPGRERTTLELPRWAIGGLSVSSNGESLAFLASQPDQDHGYGLTSLYRWDLAEGRLVDLSSALDQWVSDECGTDVPAPSSARPQFEGERVWALLSSQGRVMAASFTEGQVERFRDMPRAVYDFALTARGVALALADPVHPSGIALVGPDGQERIAWAPTPWSAPEDRPVAPEEFWAVESDGTRVHTWYLRPRTGTNHPVILEIHGGPMAMYGYRYFHEFQCLVSAGYAVVYTNPRGSTGYGREFCAAIKGEWGDKDYRDVLAGLEQALERWPGLDTTRLGVAGGSYGGFMVNWIISHDQRFAAAVTMRSVVNRFSAMGSSDMGWLRVPQYGTKPWWEEPAPYWQQSPLKYVSNVNTPLLIEHQEKDFRLPVEQGEQLYSALKYLGRTVEMLLYPDESHGMSRGGKPWHRVYRLHSIQGWFDRFLQT